MLRRLVGLCWFTAVILWFVVIGIQFNLISLLVVGCFAACFWMLVLLVVRQVVAAIVT